MARVEPEKWDDKSIELVYVAGTVVEAEKVEVTLTRAGIDFTIGPEQFQQGVLSIVLGSTNSGAGFFVLEGQAKHSRAVLRAAGPTRRVVELGAQEAR